MYFTHTTQNKVARTLKAKFEIIDLQTRATLTQKTISIENWYPISQQTFIKLLEINDTRNSKIHGNTLALDNSSRVNSIRNNETDNTGQ